MSSFGVIKKGNIYDDQEFNEQPYTQTDKFQVFIPKQKDIMVDLIQKEKSKKQDTYQRIPSKVITSQQYQRPGSQQSQLSQQSQKQLQQSGERSQFKQKLQNSVQQGRQQEQNRYENNENNEQQQQQQYQQGGKNLRVNNSQVSFRPQSSAPQTSKSQVFQQRPGGTSYQKKRWQPKTTGYTQQQETMKKTQSKLRNKLYFDEKTMSVPKTTLKNRIIENIVQEPNVFLGNKNLLDSVYKLKQLNLLKNHDIHVQKLPGIGKFNFVYNDFHSKSTNNGFSRNDFGGFYTR